MYVAACTTAAGRQRIYDAKRIVETEFGGEVIYGDTDSIFIKFPTKDLAESIQLGQKAAERITYLINRKPYRIEYEKTLFPFILFCRKRYVGMLYEDDPTKKPKRKEMGIALKRRDSAPIVKDVFGGALDILMEERDIRKAQRFVNEKLADVLQHKIPLEKFILTKQLGDNYKNPEQLAHVVLANRMKERDPGSAPQVGDRSPFVYVSNLKDKKKQGDRIEHVDYVRQQKRRPDAEFYTTNQIQNPVAQMFALAIEQLEGYRPRFNYKDMLETFMEDGMDEEEATLKVLDKKQKELDELMFQSVIKKYRKGPMDAFLKR
jgi:DNA polymerase delta subunit 1